MTKDTIDNLLQSLGSLRWLLRVSVATVYLRAASLLCLSPGSIRVRRYQGTFHRWREAANNHGQVSSQDSPVTWGCAATTQGVETWLKLS